VLRRRTFLSGTGTEAAAQPDVVQRLAATYAAWWQSVQPDLVNENIDGPAENPFRIAFQAEFGSPTSSR
jgi:hypothetical protein